MNYDLATGSDQPNDCVKVVEVQTGIEHRAPKSFSNAEALTQVIRDKKVMGATGAVDWKVMEDVVSLLLHLQGTAYTFVRPGDPEPTAKGDEL